MGKKTDNNLFHKKQWEKLEMHLIFFPNKINRR